MRRYLITTKLKNSIRNNKNSMREMSKNLDFEIKNIIYRNNNIREDHLEKLNRFLKTNFKLKEIYLDYGKNLGKNAFTQPIKNVRKNFNTAEMIGIMLGDGNLWKNQIKIFFDKRNKKYINYVSNLFKEIFGIKPKLRISEDTNQANLYCYNRYATQKLIDLGLKRGNKVKNNIGIPAWIKENKRYFKPCIKGLIDTDGCIYKCKRENQTYIKFTNFSKQLLNDFKEITDSLGYSFARANKNNWCLYRKNEVAKFIKCIKPLKAVNGAMG